MEIARMSISLIFSRLGEMVASLFYFTFIGHYIISALSAASLAWALASFLTVIGIGFFSALIVRVAGSKDLKKDNIAQDLNISFRYAFFFGVVIVIGISAYAFNVYSSPGTANMAGAKLLVLISLYLPAAYVQLAVFNFFNAIRETYCELICTWLFNLSLMIAGLFLALAKTNPEILCFVSLYVALKWIYTILVLVVFSRSIRVHIPEFRYLQKISKAAYVNYFLNGMPLALCLGGESLLFFMFTFISKTLGEKSLAAYQASLHFLSVVYMISIGVGTATGIIVARHFMSKEFAVLRQIYVQGAAFGLMVLVPILILSFLLRDYIALLYTSEIFTRRLIEKNIVISMPFLLFEYIYIVTRMTLRSMGDFWMPSLLTIATLNIFGLAISSVLFQVYEYSVSSIFLTFVACSFILMILLLSRLAYIFRMNMPSNL